MSAIKMLDKQSPIVKLGEYTDKTLGLVADSVRPLLAKTGTDYDVFRAGLSMELEHMLAKLGDKEREYLRGGAFASVVVDAAHQAATMGLVPGRGPTGRHAAIIVRFNKSRDAGWAITGHTTSVQPEWRGVIWLIRRSNPEIEDITIGVVADGEEVSFDQLSGEISHKTGGMNSRDASIELSPGGFELVNNCGGYAVVTFKSGRKRLLTVSKADVLRSINASQTMRLPYPGSNKDPRQSSPWVVHTNPMVYKTIAHALFRKPDIWSGTNPDQAICEAMNFAEKAIIDGDQLQVGKPAEPNPEVATVLGLAKEANIDLDKIAASLGFDSLEQVATANPDALMAAIERAATAP